MKIPPYLAGVGFVQSVTDYGKGNNNNTNNAIWSRFVKSASDLLGD